MIRVGPLGALNESKDAVPSLPISFTSKEEPLTPNVVESLFWRVLWALILAVIPPEKKLL